MLSSSAIRAFIERKRRSYDHYREASPGALRGMLQGLPVKPPIFNSLRFDQQVCFIIGAEQLRWGFFLDTGIGKTYLSVALCRYFKKAGIGQRFLVLVPARVNLAEWEREIDKHRPSATLQVLQGSTKTKWKQLEDSNSTMVVCTYAGLIHMLCEGKVTRKGNRMKPAPKHLKRLLQSIDGGLIMDESTSIGNHRKLPFRLCRALAKQLPTAFCLTGTPFGRDPTPLWAQLNVLDNGKTLGETLGLFRAALFKEKPGFFGVEYEFDPKKTKLLHSMLRSRTIRIEADAATLPPVVLIKKVLSLPHEQQSYVDAARKAIRDSKGDRKVVQNSFLRARQISSGFLGYKDDEAGTRAEIEFTPNPKLEMLLSLLQGLGEQQKALVFHEFVFSGSIIGRELDRLEIGHARVFGGTKDPQKELLTFLNDPTCRVLVVNNAAGAFGLNLQVAQYSFYYESPCSPIIRKQTERRNERQGSEHSRVFRYDLVTAGTFDERILQFHKQGRDLFKAIITGEEPA